MTNPITEIDLTEFLCEQISSFYLSNSDCYPDVILCVEDQKLPAHRFIMGARCEYFHKLFSTALNKPNQKEFIIEAPLKSFQIILQYFYTGKITLHNINDMEILIQVIDLIEKYCLFDLKPYFENYIIQILSIDNVCQLFEVARIYNLEELKIKSLELIDRNSETILNSKSFNKFSKESLDEIITRKSFDDFPQLCIFNALNDWSKSGNRNIEVVLPLLKWHLMTAEDLLIIRNLGNLNPQMIFDSMEKKNPKMHVEDARFDENFALPKYNTCTGDMTLLNTYGYTYDYMTILNGNSTSYDENNGYTRHLISDGNDGGIIIDLKSIRTINHLKILLWDRDNRSYSYFIEIATRFINWKRIIDYSSYSCSSWQNLYFEAEPIRFIKLVGTHCSKNKYFDVVTFEAYLRANIPEIRDGIIVPKENVALLLKGATILERNGNYAIFDVECSDESTHHAENGCILMRLSQPYHISSIKLLLDDFGERQFTLVRYKFKIQISLNMDDWETVVNQEEFVTSWQTFCFSSKPIIFIKFIGTEVSDNDNEYYLQHFECPAQD